MDQFENSKFRKLLSSYPPKALKFLYKEYASKLIAFSVSFTHDSDASEDIVQETFNLVWEKHEELANDHDMPIEAYLYRVVRNKSISHFKSTQAVQKKMDAYLSAFQDTALSIEQVIIERESFGRIRLAIAGFPRRERECLLMKVDEDLSTAEIADVLDVSVKAVQRSLTCAYKRLRLHFFKKA